MKRIAILVVALLPVLALGYIAFHHNETTTVPMAVVAPLSLQESVPVPPTLVPPVSSTPPTKEQNISLYNDGTFTATGSYVSPGGSDALDVTITVKNDIISDVSLIEKPSNPVSKQWQETFAFGYKVFVVGKNLADLRLANVSGSSLTPVGFNDALEKIRIQAKAI